MDQDPLIDRITKLLRIARDLAGTPEGDTAAQIAAKLMSRAGVQVELEDEQEAAERSAMLVVEPEPVPWPEYLGTTLAVAYRCFPVSLWTGIAWQFWIYSDDVHRVSVCQDHYRFLEAQIRRRIDTTASRLLHIRYQDADRYEAMCSSYAEGLVCDASRRLLERLGWTGTLPFMAEGFDQDEFEARADDPLDLDAEEDTGEPGLKRYRYRAPAQAPFVETPLEPPPDRVMDVDPVMFARGTRDSGYLALIPSHLAHAFRPLYRDRP